MLYSRAQAVEIPESQAMVFRSSLHIINALQSLKKKKSRNRKATLDITQRSVAPDDFQQGGTGKEGSPQLSSNLATVIHQAHVATLIHQARVVCHRVSELMHEFLLDDQQPNKKRVILDIFQQLVTATGPRLLKENKSWTYRIGRGSRSGAPKEMKSSSSIILSSAVGRPCEPKLKYLLPTFQAAVIETEQPEQMLAHVIGGSRFLKWVLSVLRSSVYSFIAYVFGIGSFFMTFIMLIEGSSVVSTCAMFVIAVSLVCQAIRAGIYNVQMMSVTIRSFSTWYFILILFNLALCGALCASTTTIGLGWVLFLLMVSTNVFGDALPQRASIRLSIVIATNMVLLTLAGVGIGLWLHLLKGLGNETQIRVFGMGLDVRQTMMSGCLLATIYFSPFAYRAFTSQSKLVFITGLGTCRLSESQARFVLATQPGKQQI